MTVGLDASAITHAADNPSDWVAARKAVSGKLDELADVKGDVYGPKVGSEPADGAIAVFDGTTGKLIRELTVGADAILVYNNADVPTRVALGSNAMLFNTAIGFSAVTCAAGTVPGVAPNCFSGRLSSIMFVGQLPTSLGSLYQYVPVLRSRSNSPMMRITPLPYHTPDMSVPNHCSARHVPETTIRPVP